MKRLLAICFILTGFFASAQEPITWKFTIEPLSGHYLLKCNAHVSPGWHLYSQVQPKSAIAVPTSFRFNRNPLLALPGKVWEKGKLEMVRDKVLQTEAWQYTTSVAFQQKVLKKTKAKTALSGSVTYQLCTDEKCLPPKTVPFSVAIE